MILQVEAINTYYGKSHILQDISLNVKAGEVVALLGRKGVGKTKSRIAKAKMAIIDNALGRFYLDCGRFPDNSEGLDVLLIAPSNDEDKWPGPYAKASEHLDP